MPKTYTVKDVAQYLGYSTNSIYTFLKEKRIQGVRVGRGRFRISEEELARVLHLSKKPQQEVTALVQPSSPFVALGDARIIVDEPRRVPAFRELLAPNIFDWFTGMAAVVAGFGLFLFNSSLIRPEVSGFSNIMVYIRIILIATGLGVVGTAVFTQNRGWHKFFHALLGTLGLVNGVMFFRGGDIDGAILYGIMGLVVWLGVTAHPKGSVLLGIYVSLLAILFPIWMVTAGGSPLIITIGHVVNLSQPWLGIVVTIASISYLVLFWTGMAGKRPAFVAAGVLASILCFGAAVWYGETQYWSRAFFVIVLGFFCGFAAVWDWFCVVTPRRQRLLIHGLFAGVGGVLLLVALVVFLLQRHAWNTSKTEFFNRVGFAQQIVTDTIDAAKSAAILTASNPEVVRALEKNDVMTLVAASKLLYESNPVIRRVVVLSAEGEGVSLYPYGTFDLENYAFRDYFTKARDTRSVYVSNVFAAAVDKTNRAVLSIAAPLFATDGTFVGVIALSVDLERLGLRLRQLAVESRGEYFVIIDQNKMILSHPDASMIGTTLPQNDRMYSVPSTEKGVAGGVLPDGLLALIAFGPVEELGWMVTLRMPAREVYGLTQNAVVWVFGVLSSMIIAGSWFAAVLRLRWVERVGGGP